MPVRDPVFAGDPASGLSSAPPGSVQPQSVQPPPARSPLLSAAGLALGAAVALGFGRFSYALLLPPMRDSLAWNYTQAGSLNTANGLGYLLGAVLAPLFIGRWGARPAFLAAMLLTALGLLLTPLSGQFGWLIVWRLIVGLGGAVTFTAGGLLAAQAASLAPARQAGTVLTTFYAGASLGILLTGLGLPPLLANLGPGGWRAGWALLGVASLVGLAVAYVATRSGSARGQAGAPTGSAPIGAVHLRPLSRSLLAYACSGLGYVAYTTFSVTYLRAQGASTGQITLFWTLLGLAGLLAPLLWSRLLAKVWGGRTMGVLMAVMSVGAALPVLSAAPWVAALSAVLFGATCLSVVASTTALARQSLPPAVWGAGVATYTITFAAFQSLGPLLTGALADHGAGGLRLGLGLSALVLLIGAGLAFSQRRVDVLPEATATGRPPIR
ncbi:YbfB/YjiJ family MFS transporter [Deinococcus altitudinis]|uniref:YbfB/YjiJ family MFS transporter n=1 Tax=Deinococcus altitudinis TaxID=468914 RepID=UPI003892AA59